jgi:hypothetical protein
MKGQQIEYFDDELAWIEAHKDWPRKQLHQGFVARFERHDVSQQNLTALCKRKGWLTGRTGRFVSGQEAHNKGKPMPAHPNSVATRFKKGGLPHNTRHLGHERMTKEGYVEISVAETNPHTGYERRYVHKHRWLWEKQNGPIPEGHVLKCLDGDKSNTDPSNWEAIPRAILPRLNGRFGRDYDTASPEVKPTILLVAKLEHQAREMKKGEAI